MGWYTSKGQQRYYHAKTKHVGLTMSDLFYILQNKSFKFWGMQKLHCMASFGSWWKTIIQSRMTCFHGNLVFKSDLSSIDVYNIEIQ